MDELIKYLATWGLLGYFALIVIPRKYFMFKSRKSALLALILIGPMGWILFPFAVIRLKLENKSTFLKETK